MSRRDPRTFGKRRRFTFAQAPDRTVSDRLTVAFALVSLIALVLSVATGSGWAMVATVASFAAACAFADKEA